ncbi:hypothetical protein FZI85_28915 [Mycobacterium sp. CBMA293]|uniref:cell division protein PerM n=1 Tax=unclassified Mycolicibacterium TaxID=2636767 RepID=UPI001320F70B|nr:MULTISPECIES: DUF6350 family protein [unclassified Mycolicibacterium]MUL49600.1 hypothetical protein [Mycolicibacterium sp. CBMA 360]MUL96580.1 hypothetical protein [Mycolicibacterium sp. CBMA 230]MUM33888.1 hypothetical protein [Mycolicibacterium sp. CBMA 361]MUL61567.1 hypothetical protein [Mycolicibacterium sp. CBMA 335]MUL74302.1 hypothetical protein [Mycolicibacterium sp. CBMA 311]
MDNRPVGTRQARDLLRVAFGPSGIALAIIAALTLLQLVIANSDLTGAFGAMASMWLGVHGVPVSIGGAELGVMPLAPLLAMVWGTFHTTAAATRPGASWFVVRWIVASALGGPLLIAALALAVIHDASSVLTELQTPSALQAFGCVLAVHAVGALLGVGSRMQGRLLTDAHLPYWLPEALRAALAGVLALLGLSGLAAVGSMVVHWATMHDLYSVTDSMFGQFSLTLLSALYIPNVMVGAAAVAVGSSVHIGLATFSSFTVLGGDIPAIPVLAAVPSPPLGPVWVALLIIAAASAVAVGQQCARRPAPWPIAASKLVVASLLAAVLMVLLAIAGSGRLGNFGELGVDQTTFGPGVFLWFASIGGLTVAMSGGLTRRPARPAPVAPVDDEPYDEEPAGVVEDDEPVTETLFGDVAGAPPDVDDDSHFAGGPAFEPSPEPAAAPQPQPEPAAKPAEPRRPSRPEPNMTPAPAEAYQSGTTDRIGEHVAFDPDEDPEAHFVVDDDGH